MKEITKKWVEISDRDLESARIMFKSKYWQHTVMMSHQSIEKAMKSHLAENNIKIPRTHDLSRLVEIVNLDFSDKQLYFVESINPHYQPNRYPDITYKWNFHYNEKSAEEFLSGAIDLTKWLKSKLNTKK